MKMATVSPMPAAVVNVDTGRWKTLRTLYAEEWPCVLLLDATQRVDDAEQEACRAGSVR